MITEETDNMRFDAYDTWGEFVAHAASPCDMPDSDRASLCTDKEGWNGTATYADADKLARMGWKDGANKAYTLSHDIETRLYNLIERTTISYDVTGEILDIGRYCSGEPEHWGVFESQLVEGPGVKHVHIVANSVCSCGIDAEAIMERGAAIVALIHLLELAGHRTRVSLVMANSPKDLHYEYRVPLKHYQESLDIDALAYALAHPSCLRRLGFSVMEHLPEHVRDKINVKAGRGYGYPVESKGDKGDIYLPEMEAGDARWTSGDTATKWVHGELIRLGVIKEEAHV